MFIYLFFKENLFSCEILALLAKIKNFQGRKTSICQVQDVCLPRRPSVLAERAMKSLTVCFSQRRSRCSGNSGHLLRITQLAGGIARNQHPVNLHLTASSFPLKECFRSSHVPHFIRGQGWSFLVLFLLIGKAGKTCESSQPLDSSEFLLLTIMVVLKIIHLAPCSQQKSVFSKMHGKKKKSQLLKSLF